MEIRTLRTITVTIVETWVLVWDEDGGEQEPADERQVTYIAQIERRTISRSAERSQSAPQVDLPAQPDEG